MHTCPVEFVPPTLNAPFFFCASFKNQRATGYPALRDHMRSAVSIAAKQAKHAQEAEEDDDEQEDTAEVGDTAER
jgi:hypothetical protein